MALYKGSTKLSGTGDGFHPEHEGNTGQILYKTAGGYDWDVVIQSDWNQTNQSAPDYIKNKPIVDSSLDTGSTNAIQNGAVATAVNSITGDISTIQGQIISIGTDKQDTLVSGTNIKTINSTSILGSGNIAVQPTLVSGTNIKTINSNSILGSGNLEISGLPSGGTTGQVITKTTNGAVWADNPGITISGASFGSFINACKANGDKHTITVSDGGTTYTMKGLGFIFVHHNVGHALSVNGVTVFSDSFTSGGYEYMYYAGPITLGPGDVIEIWKPGSSGYFGATIYDWYDGTTPLSKAGIYHNANQGLISLSSNGSDWLTMADKNLGATSVWNKGDSYTVTNCGNFYQWGNNYAFPFNGAPSTSTATADVSSYGPDNYYSNSTFRKSSTYDTSWMSTVNLNLWGDTTNTNITRRGPCSTGFHIPGYSDISQLKQIIQTGLGINSNTVYENNYLKLPNCGHLWRDAGSKGQVDYITPYWMTGHRTEGGQADTLELSKNDSDNKIYIYYGNVSHPDANGALIRPFKNESVAPTLEWDILYQASS